MTAAAQTLAEEQLVLLRRMAALDPAPVIFGGYAEDALLAGTVTRAHVDIDWLVPRSELGLRLEQARALDFDTFVTMGEAAPGEPFYLRAENGPLMLELGILDGLELRVQRLFFDGDGATGYRLLLPEDTFSYPPVSLDGIELRVPSPLALYQFRAGIAAMGSFGALSDRHRAAGRALNATFLGGRPEYELLPDIQPLRGSRGQAP